MSDPNSIPAVESLLVKLRRWQEMYPSWKKAAPKALAVAKGFLDADFARTELEVVCEYDSLCKAIRHDADMVAADAERLGISSAPLLLFADEPDQCRLETANAVVLRVRVIGGFATDGGRESLETQPTEADHYPTVDSEEAAVLKVLLQAGGVKVKAKSIPDILVLSEKTVRNKLKQLISVGLVEEPTPKKGYCLTAKGRSLAKGLSADAGLKLFFRQSGRSPRMPGDSR